jgi:hypothetical protein
LQVVHLQVIFFFTLLLFGSGIIAKKTKTYYITFICDIIYIKPKPETKTLKLKTTNKLLIIKKQNYGNSNGSSISWWRNFRYAYKRCG